MASEILSVWAAGLPPAGHHLAAGATPFRIYYDATHGFGVVDPSGNSVGWGPPEQVDRPNRLERRYSITLVGVPFVRFHASGWPSGGVPDLSLRAVPDQPHPERLRKECLPFAHDLDFITAHERLAGIAATGFSLIRLTRIEVSPSHGTPDFEPAGQWLNFRLSLLDHDLLERPGGSRLISAQEVVAAGMAGLSAGNKIDFEAVTRLRTTAELQNVLIQRTPYMAGGFRDGDREPLLESFALNATALEVLGASFSAFKKIMIPSDDQRWGHVAALQDGFWWASKPDDPENAQLRLDEALKNLPCFPDRRGGPGRRPILARMEPAGIASAAQLAVIDMLGLRAAKVQPRDPGELPNCQGAASIPYHYLHTRQDANVLEWRRWIALEAGAEAAAATFPVLLKVRRQDGEPGSSGALTIRLEGLTDRHFLDIWARKVARPLREKSKREGTTGDLTLVPEFTGITDSEDERRGGLWCAQFDCEEPWPDTADRGERLLLGRYRLRTIALQRMTERAVTDRGGSLDVLTSPSPRVAAGHIEFTASRIQLSDLLTQAESATALRFRGDIHLKLDAGGGPAELKFKVGSDLDWLLQTPHSVTISADKIEPDDENLVAIGGLDIEFRSDQLPEYRFDVEATNGGLDYEFGRDSAPLILPVNSVGIGGADLDQDDPGKQPLLWGEALMGEGTIEAADYRSRESGKRSISFDLRPGSDAAPGLARTDVTILDPSPMFIAKVSAAKLAAPTDTRQSAASWQSSEGLWRLTPPSDKRQEISLTLPPQGVAEAWERSAEYLPEDQVGEAKRLPARLVPASELRLEGDERARNQIAPWNLRHIMGFSDADLPGARLLSIERLEVLYGLEGWTGELSGFRLAEMAGWRGVPREALTRDEARGALWNSALGAWQRRLAVLDLRDERDLSVRPRLTNARFRLRRKTDDDAGGGKQIQGDGAKYIRPYKDDAAPDENFWTMAADGGILGGALAGFEQPPLVETLHGRRDGAGEFEGLQLSALGAWTHPRAAFQNGLTLISSEVAMGRVHEARFERKGRIGALHHLAKHVIVYRRAFLPSRQFAGEQNPNRGRPVVRKVEEYIEITQPVRSYPDRVGATELNAGPLIGARFRTIRIPVHGSWATPLSDPRVKGYSIPLWRQAEDPGIYPRPVIEMLMAGDPNRSEPEPLARRVETPDRLRFYTITALIEAEPSGDIESWPLVYGIDFVDRALDNPIYKPITLQHFQRAEAPGAMLEPAPAEAPGLEPFTLRLEAGPGVNVMQGRAQKPAIADLRSLLVMRARAPQSPPKEAEELRDVIAAADFGHQLAELARTPAGPGPNPIETLKNKAKDKLNQLKDALPNKNPIASKTWCGWAHAPAKRLVDLLGELEIVGRLEDMWKRNRNEAVMRLRRLQTAIDALLPLEKTAANLLKPFVDQAARAGDEFRQELERQLEEVSGRIGQAAQQWQDSLGSFEQEIDTLKKLVVGGQENAVAALARLQSEVAQRLRDADGRLAELARHLPKLDEAAAQLRKAAPKIGKAAPKASGLALTLARQLEDARKRLSELHARASTTICKALAAAQTKLSQWSRDAKVTADVIEDLLDEASSRAKTLRADTDAIVRELQRLIESAPAILFERLAEELVEARERVADIADEPLEIVEEGLRDISAIIVELRRRIEEAEPPADLMTRLREAEDRVRDPIDAVRERLGKAGADLCDFVTQADAVAAALLEGWRTEIDKLIKGVDDFAGEIEALRAQLDGYARGIGTALDRLRGGIEEVLEGKIIDKLMSEEVTPNGLGQAVALNLLRAAGAPPVVEQLLFNRERIAYHFEAEAQRVIITPVTALVDQVDQALRGVGLALPTLGIGETLLAPAHQAFEDLRRKVQDGVDPILKDLQLKARQVLKDFAGLKDLLPKLDFGPKLASAIKVTHDYDAQRNVAWLQADINYGPETQDLFRHDAFAVVAERMVLTGTSRYERGLSGGEKKSVKASIVSDWLLIIGGMPLVRIREAAIRYDDKDGLKFDIRPEKVEFPGPLQLLTTALSSLDAGSEPLSIELLNDPATGRPVGLKSRYDLPPTSFGVGAVAVMNAAMGVHLDLAQRSEFEIRSFAYFGRNDSPFAMTVSLLGGGGYVEAEATHLPASRKTDIALRVSIGLAAGTGFNFGPLKGSIQLYLGFEASFYSGSAGSRISITALFVLSGSVTAWGFVTVSLGVRLALTYDGRKMVGHGSIKVEVRISRFYKKRFSRPITYRL